MHWNCFPDICAVSLLVLVFISIHRKRQSPCTWNCIAGWIFVDARFVALSLSPGHSVAAATVLDILATSSLAISGVLFFISTLEPNQDFQTQRLIALSSIIPSALYIVLFDTVPRRFLLEMVVLLGYAALFTVSIYYFHRRGKYSVTFLAGAVLIAVASFVGLLQGNLEAPLIFGLTGIFGCTALSYWRRYERLSPGVVIAVLGFFSWGLVFPLAEWMSGTHPGLIEASSGMWNLPKYFVAGAMVLTLFEDEIIAAERLMHRYRLQFDRSLCGVYRCTATGEMLECNDAFVRMLQHSREEIFSSNLAVLLGADAASGATLIEQLARNSQVIGAEYVIPVGSGSPRRLIGNASLVNGDSALPPEIEGTILDITDFTTLRDQIRDSQKLEALGLLAGGVAHDFNNLLMVISGHVELLESILDSDPQVRTTMEAVRSATERGAAITTQLLAFSRKGTIKPELLDMNAVLEDARTLLQPVVGEHVAFEFKPGQGRLSVMADENQIVLVLLNLVINSRDAMPDGGRLLLESSSVELDEGLASAQGLASTGHYVCVSVSDTGTGIPPGIKARVFEPFFTTKPLGKGTGLGLSICYGIVREHGGNITVTSSPGIGTTVRFYLPMAAAPAAEPHQEPTRSFHASLLLVDDEDTLRKAAAEFLVRFGFQVTEASSSEEALQIFTQDKFDLVVTDMVMPGMTGKQLSDELKKLSPNLPVIYISGYAQDILESQGQLDPGDILLQKPYTLKRLLHLIEEGLEKQSGAVVRS